MGLAGYLDSLNLDPVTRDKLVSQYAAPMSTADTPPPPPGMTYEGNGPRTDTTAPDHVISKPAAKPSIGDEIRATLNDPSSPYRQGKGNAVPLAKAIDKATGPDRIDAADAVTGAPEFRGLTTEQIRRGERNTGANPASDGEEEGGAGAPHATPGHYVGAKWVPTTRAMTTQHGIDESKLEPGQRERAIATNYAQWSAEDTKKAAEQEALGDVAYAAAHKDAVDQYQAQAQRVANERQAYTIREHEKLDQLATAAQAQVDPEAAKGSMGAQILAALSVGLGQFGASLNGGTNTALQIVNGNIDRRIHAQEANIANAHKALGNEQNLYKANLEAFGDKERAALATKMQYLDQAKAQLDQVYAGAKSNRNDAQYHAMSEGIANKKAEYLDQFGIRTADQVATTGSEHYERAHMEGGSTSGKDLPNLVEHNGTTYQLPNEKEHGKAVTTIQTMNRLQRYNNDALAARARIYKLNPVTDMTKYKTELKTLRDLEEDKAALISTGLDQGTLRDSEYLRSIKRQGFYTDGIGYASAVDPTARAERESSDANIRRQTARGDQDIKAYIHAARGHVVKSGYAHDAAGNLSPVAKYTGQDVTPAEALPPKGFRPMRADQETPTADTPDVESTPQSEDFGLAAPTTGTGKGGKGHGPTVKKRK